LLVAVEHETRLAVGDRCATRSLRLAAHLHFLILGELLQFRAHGHRQNLVHQVGGRRFLHLAGGFYFGLCGRCGHSGHNCFARSCFAAVGVLITRRVALVMQVQILLGCRHHDLLLG
jgi:hypothetical protein